MLPTSSKNPEETPFSGIAENATTTNEAVEGVAAEIPTKAVPTDAIPAEAVPVTEVLGADDTSANETTEGDANEDTATEDNATEDNATEGHANEDAAAKDAATEVAATKDAATDDNSTATAAAEAATGDVVGKTPKKRASKKGITKKAKKPAGVKKTRSSGRTAEDTGVNSIRLTAEGAAALLVLQTLDPKKTKIDLVSDALQLAARMISAQPVIRLATLDGAEFVRVRAENAKLELILGSFRKDLIQIEKNPDSFEKLAALVTKVEKELAATVALRDRLGTLALLPTILSPENSAILFDLKYFLRLWQKDVSTDEAPLLEMALELLTPYLP